MNMEQIRDLINGAVRRGLALASDNPCLVSELKIRLITNEVASLVLSQLSDPAVAEEPKDAIRELIISEAETRLDNAWKSAGSIDRARAEISHARVALDQLIAEVRRLDAVIATPAPDAEKALREALYYSRHVLKNMQGQFNALGLSYNAEITEALARIKSALHSAILAHEAPQLEEKEVN